MAQRVVPLRPAGVSDGELVRRAQQGDQAASTRLFRLHAGHVARVLANLVGVHRDLPDLTQDVFLVAFRELDRLREPEAFRSWLTGIAVNRARHVRRARGRSWWLRFVGPEELPDTASGEATPEIRGAVGAADAVLSRLPDEERVAFVLRFVEKMQLEEIAEVSGVSLATVKRRIASARERFVAAARRDARLAQWVEGAES